VSPGDVNFDGNVDGSDIAVFTQDFQSGASAADLDDNGELNAHDIDLFIELLVAP